jgi:hypothetical protein
MRKLFYCGLEKYKGRYTLQLQDWNERVFKRRNIDYVIVEGETLGNDQAIVTGQVLDAHGRSYFSMTQMANLVKMMKQGLVTSEDVIFFEDMYTPGIESLPYIINQIPEQHRPKIFVRCLAQTIDPDDFVHVWNMSQWMGYYEKMVDSFVDGVLASSEEMVMHMKIAGWTAPVYNISGLAFGKEEVRSRIGGVLKPFDQRSMRVAFSARTDQEKQPHFYLDLIDEYLDSNPAVPVEFAIFSGSPLRGNDPTAIDRIKRYQSLGKIKVYDNLEKNDYYALLNDTRVLFNCALQDWFSNTVSEADALGCNVLYPAYRSFPEAFANDHERLYVPWSKEDAINKLDHLLQYPHANMGEISDWTDGCIDRTLDIIEGHGEKWARNKTDYRKYTNEKKY